MELSLLDMGKTKKRNVRESVISILSKDYPLSIKKIYNSVKKEYHLDVTYQAVFKLIKEMLEDNILEKEESGMEYKINIGWIKQLENELNMIKKNYGSPEGENKEIPLGDRINSFITKVGSSLKDYIGSDKCLVIAPSGTGQHYAINLWKYLNREGIDAKYVIFDKLIINAGKKMKLNSEDFIDRKVLFVDYGIFSGSIYKVMLDNIKPFRKKFKIKDIKCAVDIDLLGLADFSVSSSAKNLNTQTV